MPLSLMKWSESSLSVSFSQPSLDNLPAATSPLEPSQSGSLPDITHIYAPLRQKDTIPVTAESTDREPDWHFSWIDWVSHGLGLWLVICTTGPSVELKYIKATSAKKKKKKDAIQLSTGMEKVC